MAKRIFNYEPIIAGSIIGIFAVTMLWGINHQRQENERFQRRYAAITDKITRIHQARMHLIINK